MAAVLQTLAASQLTRAERLIKVPALAHFGQRQTPGAGWALAVFHWGGCAGDLVRDQSA